MQQHTPIAASPTGSLARTPLLPLVLIVSLFFLWGVANNLNDVLVAQFKKAFTLSDFQAGLVQSAFYLGYFLLAIPAGMFMRRFGYKAAVVFGLALYGAGALLFWPAAATATYDIFLAGLFVIAAGLAFLETSANPWVTLLGPRESAASRLNLAQAFNPLGSITGVLIGQHFIFTGVERTPAELAAMDVAARTAYMKSEAAAVQMPYLLIGLGVIAWAVLIVLTRFPRTAAEGDGSDVAERGVLGRLFRDARFMSAVLAQFFYVGAQVSVFSYMIRYAQATMPGTAEKTAANFITAGLLCFMAGRFAGAAIMKYLRPAHVLRTFALVNIALAAAAAFVPGRVGIYALVASSFFMSIMYPTIFALGVEGRSDAERKLGASLLVMSIVGGAVLTAAMGAASDRFGIAHAMLVPMLCFVAIFLFAWRRTKGREAVA
ncbi:L-fucose:H+ symporter permease [Luteibacter jiangsuensis]|uniref:L-fucose:H+ symporter permease n=1 Tax=Luteibacter jiangsuensis TaxID=637577 RepID=A0ABX0QB61_9GAMM|nr:L-fucose:H+ symporter permease [Luteibacter jiangsuensis]NID06702.1 L-fucose:H+ symporter permease [Luteibacter jiangsuensis]